MQNQIIKYNGVSFQVKIQDEADESVLNEIFKFREYKAAEETIKNATDCIIDVGAHRGFFTLYARSLNPTVPIIAIEPEPANVKALEDHLKINSITGVTVIPQALFAVSGKAKLVVTPDSHNHVLELVDTPAGERATVKTTTLAQLLEEKQVENVDLIKMDIEGAEYAIFTYLDPSVWLKLRRIILEYHTIPGHRPAELEKCLRENGFGVEKFPSKFDNTMGFFVGRNKRIKK